MSGVPPQTDSQNGIIKAGPGLKVNVEQPTFTPGSLDAQKRQHMLAAHAVKIDIADFAEVREEIATLIEYGSNQRNRADVFRNLLERVESAFKLDPTNFPLSHLHEEISRALDDDTHILASTK